MISKFSIAHKIFTKLYMRNFDMCPKETQARFEKRFILTEKNILTKGYNLGSNDESGIILQYNHKEVEQI